MTPWDDLRMDPGMSRNDHFYDTFRQFCQKDSQFFRLFEVSDKRRSRPGSVHDPGIYNILNYLPLFLFISRGGPLVAPFPARTALTANTN